MTTATIEPIFRHCRVILALLRREEEIRRKEPLETVLNLLEPVFLLGTWMSMGYLVSPHLLPPFGDSFLLFYATGFFATYFFIYIARRMKGGVESLRRRFPIEARLDHVFTHIILRIIDYTILGVAVFGLLYAFVSSMAIPSDMTPILLACCAIIGLGFGFGVINIVIGRVFWLWIYLWPLLCRAMMVISGTVFIPDFLPPSTRYWLSFNPELHIIVLFRTGFYPTYPDAVFDGSYLIGSILFLVILGLVLERMTARREGHPAARRRSK